MNVMLTRCEAGMIIVTNRRFVEVGARDTLLGQLVDHWRHEGAEEPWTCSSLVAAGTAKLPGILSPQPVEPNEHPKASGLRGNDANHPGENATSQVYKRPRSPDILPLDTTLPSGILQTRRVRCTQPEGLPRNRPLTQLGSYRQAPPRQVVPKREPSDLPDPPHKRQRF